VALFCREESGSVVVHESVERYSLLDRIRYVEARRRRKRHTVLAAVRHPGWVPRMFRIPGGRAAGTTLRLASALASEGRFDVVHAHYGDVALHAATAAGLVGAPLVASFYGYDCSSYPIEHGPSVFAPLFARAAVVTSLSEAMDGALRGLGCPSDRIRRHRIGVDVRQFSPTSPATDGSPRVLTVARLVEKKGVATLLQALALLRQRFPTLLCDVVGDGPLRPALEAFAGSALLDGVVRFHGAQPESRVLQLMRSATCFVLASERASDGDEEGTPTVLMEASSIGLPVVSTWHAGIPEVVRDGETGLLAPPKNPAALAERIGRLLENPELGRALGARGRRHITSNFDVPVLTRRLEAIYREAVSLA
jgi:colanic acid/amylovoran biosynthesis glycosyltransferase